MRLIVKRFYLLVDLPSKTKIVTLRFAYPGRSILSFDLSNCAGIIF